MPVFVERALHAARPTARMSAVRWGIAGRIVWAWVVTIPASAIIAAISYFLLSAIV